MSDASRGVIGSKSSSSDTWREIAEMPSAESISSSEYRRRLSAVQPNQDPKPMTKYQADLESMFEAMHIESKQAVMHPKMARGEVKGGDEAVKLTCNAFGLLYGHASIHRYEVKVIGERSGQRTRVTTLNFRPKDDAPLCFQRDDCRAVFDSIVNNSENAAFFNIASGTVKPMQLLTYDLIGSLYTSQKLDFTLAPESAECEEDSVAFVMPNDQRFTTRFASRFTRVLFVVRNNTAAPMELSDYPCLPKDLDDRLDMSTRLFIETATSQYALYNPLQHVTFETNTSYLLDPISVGFTPEDVPEIDKDKYLSIGTEKTIRLIEGMNAKKNGAAALFIASRKTPFYSEGDALNFTTAILGVTEPELAQVISTHPLEARHIQALDTALRGLYVYSRFDDRLEAFHKVLHIVSTTPVEHMITPPGGTECSIAEYYETKFNFKLQFPFAPMAECAFENGEPSKIKKGTRGPLYFPLEVLKICDNQRVHHQTPELIQKIIKACAVPPVRNFHHIMNSRKAWNFEENDVMKQLGIRVTSKPMPLGGHKLGAPIIEYTDGTSHPLVPKCTWKLRSGYLLPASINLWGCYYLSDRPSRQEQTIQRLVVRYLQACRDKGMMIDQPAEMTGLVANEKDMDEKFRAAQAAGCEFMLFIHDEREKQGHSLMKLLERRYDIPTQGVRSVTVNNILQKGQNQTLENIVNKTNMKMGGLNYSLRLNPSNFQLMMADDVLYIGFAVSKPAGGLSTGSGAPDVIGYAANIKKHPFDFIGDFAFVTGGIESEFKLETFGNIIKHCVERFRQARQGANPRRLVVFRHGCDDGLFRMVVKYEVPFIEKKLSEIDGGSDILWSLIVPNKLHNARILPAEVGDAQRAQALSGMRPPDQNIKPGTVVDNGLVHPHYAEFFLCSHSALQGTARVPRYTILYSTDNLTLDDFERITWNLSFGHQIVFMTVSLPAPSYIANRYAERGRMLYNQNGELATSEEHLTDLTNKLSYNDTTYLRDLRVNA